MLTQAMLARSDLSASELGAVLDIPSNLLAHHLKALHAAGLLTRRQSEGDARRWYLSLAAHDDWILAGAGAADGEALVPAARIVFVCTANSARSHLAAAAWRRRRCARRRPRPETVVTVMRWPLMRRKIGAEAIEPQGMGYRLRS